MSAKDVPFQTVKIHETEGLIDVYCLRPWGKKRAVVSWSDSRLAMFAIPPLSWGYFFALVEGKSVRVERVNAPYYFWESAEGAIGATLSLHTMRYGHCGSLGLISLRDDEVKRASFQLETGAGIESLLQAENRSVLDSLRQTDPVIVPRNLARGDFATVLRASELRWPIPYVYPVTFLIPYVAEFVGFRCRRLLPLGSICGHEVDEISMAALSEDPPTYACLWIERGRQGNWNQVVCYAQLDGMSTEVVLLWEGQCAVGNPRISLGLETALAVSWNTFVEKPEQKEFLFGFINQEGKFGRIWRIPAIFADRSQAHIVVEDRSRAKLVWPSRRQHSIMVATVDRDANWNREIVRAAVFGSEQLIEIESVCLDSDKNLWIAWIGKNDSHGKALYLSVVELP
jgi:hypothetical protein